MGQYATLKAAIQDVIKTNGNKEITGALLQQALLAMINSLGDGFQFIGIATPSTNPGTPDQNVFYIASEAGTYSNFSGIIVAENEVAILKWNGTWAKETTGAATAAQLNQLGQQVPNNTARSIGGTLLPNISLSKVIAGSGNYSNSSASNYAKLVDVSNIRGGVISVTKNATNSAIIAFLCDDDISTINPRYCFGYVNRIVQTDGDTIEYTIPYDCKYLYVVVWNNNADALPTIIVKNVVNRDVDNLNYRNTLSKNLVSGIEHIYHNSIDTNLGNIGRENAARTSCVLYDVPIGAILHIELKYGYLVSINDWDNAYPKQSATGWLSGNIVDYTILHGKKIVLLFKNNLGSDLGELSDYVKAMSLSLYSEIACLKRTLSPELPINWENGVPADNGHIITQDHRAFGIIKTSELHSNKLYFASSLFKVYFRPWDGLFPLSGTSSGWLVRNGEYNITSEFLLIGLQTLDGSAVTEEKLKDVRLFQVTDDGISVAESVERNMFSYDYNGQRIELVSHYIVKRFKTLPSWQNMQGGAIYENNLVCLMAADEIPTASVNGFIYNIETGEKVCDLLFGSTLGGKTYELPHANQVSFGSGFYNENSQFPLLYVSQVNGGSQTLWQNSERGVLVYDLQTNDGGLTFTPVLVQAIIPDLTDTALMAKIGKYTPNYIIDTDKNQMVVIGYPNESWFNLNGPQPVAIFDIPAIDDGEEIVLTNEDVVDSYTFPVSLGIQQSFYFDGKIYSLGGVANAGSLRVIDLAKKAVVTTIDLTQWTNGEPQFAGLWNGKFLYYNAGTDGVIYEFIF